MSMVSIPLCQISMVLHNDGGKLFLKVERGTKPRLKLHDDSRKALVTIPYDHTTKWPLLKEQMSGGFIVIVQRLEQQYKITIQHALDKKPNVCVYVNSVANEKNLKTCVRLINTKMSHLGVAGPNLEITGVVKAQKVTFESTFGALHTNAKLTARHVALNAQHIFIKPEAMYSCQMLRMMSRKVQIDGKIYPLETDTSFLDVFVDSALLHIGVDGMIGAFRLNGDNATAKNSEVIAERLVLMLKGSLANYGRIVSRINLDIQIDGSILSLEDGRIDSAGRGYTALKQIKGITSDASASLPTSSKLSKAIESQNPDTVAQLLEDGVDPNDFVTENSVRCTPRKVAVMKYREIRATEQRNKLREKITIIQALMVTHVWRRGLITSNSIVAKVGRDCEDCAQFKATTLELTTLGSARCENDSIWSSGSVLLYISNDLVIEGQVKNHDFTVHCGGNIVVHQDGIISQENYAKINCSALFSSGIWSIGEQINVEATAASFFESSYLEAELIDLKLEEHCQHGGTWQTKYLTVLLNGTMRTLHEGKVLVDETAQVSATAFNCCGVWKVNECVQISLKESANFQPSSILNSTLLKLVNEGCCIFSGHINVENLLAYVRNDLITTASGRIVVAIGGTVAAGAFRNDASWLSECNLHLHAACFEQSEDAIIYAKDTLDLSIYDNSIEKSHGRIVAGCCFLRVNRRARFDGYIRVNQMEMYLPNSNESQCFVGGQLEVMYGPLIIRGRSEFSTSHPISVAHMHPAFVLEGQLKAEAVVAPFLAIRFSAASYTLLSGMASIAESPFKTFLSAGAIYTMRASFIDSASATDYPEAVICATTWIHEGQFRFRGTMTYIIAESFVNRGRLTNEGPLHNHMKSACVSIAHRFENESVFSADQIQITGNGELENKNRIFATDVMRIRLSNFSNEAGHMQSDNIKLLSAGKEWTKINGRIDAKGKLDISASKLSMEIKNLDFRKQMKISARAQLRVSNDIVDSQATVSLAARDAIIFDGAKVAADSINLRVGDAYETEVVVCENATLEANHLRITGKCKLLTIVVNGTIRCDSLICDSSIRNVKVIGSGTLISKGSMNFDGRSVFLALGELHAIEILATFVKISPSAYVRILPIENTSATTIYADSCSIDGRVFTSGKLNLKSSKGTIRIDGELIGTTLMSEMSAEGNDVILAGSLSNLEFLEIYARRRMEYCDTALIANTRNIAIEAEIIAFDGKLLNFDTVIATAEEIIVEGNLLSEKNGNASLFGKTVRFEGVAEGLSRLEISGRNDAYIAGTIMDVEYVCVDAKWLTCNSNLSGCTTVNLAAYSAILDGNLASDAMAVNVLGAMFIHSSLKVQKCCLNGAFIIALNDSHSVPEDSDIGAFIYITDNSFSMKDDRKVCLKVFFDHEDSENNGQLETWNGTIEAIQQSFQSPVISCGDIISALDCKNKLRSSSYSFSNSSTFYKQIRSLADRFRLEHASVFSCFDLIEIMRQHSDTLKSCENIENLRSNAEFKTEGLREAVGSLRMRLLKYTLQSPQSSVDDYGYASRSSSEDNEDKISLRASPTISITKCEERGAGDFSTADRYEDDPDGYNQYLSVPNNLYVSADESSSSSKNEESAEKENETDFVFNGEHKIPIVRIDFNCFDVCVPKPRFELSRQPTPTTDLAMKKIQVKAALSNLDLRTFGSDWSLASFETGDATSTPMRIIRSPLRRSLIPRSSFRKPSSVIA